ncbi:MAG: hypothetical protein FWE27_05290 [Defluviitaleaceae bacterium]|nr:hypothetical protein [Defluviitaleaceae bacterium]
MENTRRFITVSEYARMHKLSRRSVETALIHGQIKGFQTEKGHWRIDTNQDNSQEFNIIHNMLFELTKKTDAIIKHIGVKT